MALHFVENTKYNLGNCIEKKCITYSAFFLQGKHPIKLNQWKLTWLLFSVSSLLLCTPQQLAKIWSVGDTLGVLEEESPCSELCSWDLSEIGDKTWNLDEDKIMFDLWVLNSSFGLLWHGIERLELLWHELMLLRPAPLSEELTKLATLPWKIKDVL